MSAPGSSWSTQQLTEFLAHLSVLPDEVSALRSAAERAAEAVDAEVGAVIADGSLASCVGFPRGHAPLEPFLAIARGETDELDVPGMGPGRALAVPLEESPEGWLIVVRAGEAYTLDESNLLRGMARVLCLTVRMLRLIEEERGLRTQSDRHARDNALLLVSIRDRQRLLEAMSGIQRAITHRRPLAEILDSITDAARTFLRAEVVVLFLLDPDDGDYMTLASSTGIPPGMLQRSRVGEGASGCAIAEDRLVVIEEYQAYPNAMPAFRDDPLRIRAAAAAPVHENGRVIGSLTIASRDGASTYSETDRSALLAFAEQASMALTDARTVAAMHEARHDALTGLPNRGVFVERLTARLSPGGGPGETAILFLDLDRFKTVNDSLGHSAGDALLVEVARRLGGCVRPVDTVARLGGDEFVVMIEEVSGVESACSAARRILEALREPITISGRSVFATGSLGLVVARAGRDTVEGVLRGADLAMYQAKAEGGGRVHIYHPELNERMMRQVQLEAELRSAIERGEFRVLYQPIVDLQSGRITAFEALVRWHHPLRGTVSPVEFIPLAEETGLIVPIGTWVLEQACEQALLWEAGDGGEPIGVHVNLSVRQFQQPGLVELVEHVLRRVGLPASRLTLEITESVVVHDTAAAIGRLAELRSLGVRIAIDDFGTGYSSLSYLKRFPVDIVKIDRSFVQSLGESARDAALARAIIELARTLRLRTVAEGIETRRQLVTLCQLGCPEGQGFYFARPLLPDDALHLLGAELRDARRAVRYPPATCSAQESIAVRAPRRSAARRRRSRVRR
jgi:diguanylate cyclase (GGDEF)-like protein